MSGSTLVSTRTHSAHRTPSHGKPSNSSFEAMDVDRGGQHPATGQNTDSMDTTMSNIPSGSNQVRIPGLLVGNEIATTKPSAQAVLERPRSEENDGAAEGAQQSQLAPTPPTATGPPQDTPLTPNTLLTANLISLYGLDGLASTVARNDPKTGEKINKMRKSYEGQLKTFALSGRNKSVKHDETKGMGLVEMAAWPEEEWRNQKVHGKDVRLGMPDAMKARLEKAMQMAPGPVPENEKWEDLLGIDKAKPSADANKDRGSKSAATTKSNGQQVNGARPHAGASTGAQPAEPVRARRNTKKRRYDDGSFEGYGEGYVDDEMDVAGGYTSGESRSTRNSAGNRKRRKTKDYTKPPAEYQSRNNSFTAGPVGISAYGR